MSIAGAVTTALAQFEFDEETGFHRLGGTELPCLHCAPSAHGRLVRVVDDKPSRCTLCKRDHKKCTAAYWNALRDEFSTDRALNRLQKWRAMQCVCPGSGVGSLIPRYPEVHENANIEENIRRSVPAYARKCREANVFVAVLQRLPTAFETPFDGEDDRKRAKLPPANSPIISSTTWSV
ncbi:hypothetical protein FANTH_14725 [Fusarium anthophilum]|uniref:Uncharacterized protein n=1 Tax=Fusarium anthophilum TaxID=48485 RepID=A0A8H4YGK3_9HYPO|nr:hypothetical protein FANTH_14725 [Fusarium anthophilum]